MNKPMPPQSSGDGIETEDESKGGSSPELQLPQHTRGCAALDRLSELEEACAHGWATWVGTQRRHLCLGASRCAMARRCVSACAVWCRGRHQAVQAWGLYPTPQAVARAAVVAASLTLRARARYVPRNMGSGGLEASGMTCFRACVSAAALLEGFIEKIRDPCCEYLIVLQTRAFFDSRPCLEEVYTAIQCNVKIIPVLFEADALEAPHWPRISSADVEAQEWLTVVEKEFFSLNSVPSPPLTVLDDQRAFFEIIDEISGDAELERTFEGWQRSDELTDTAIAADGAAPSAG